MSVSVKWEDNPKALNRNILVPVRNTVSDLIYAVLASIRSEAKHLVELTTPFMTFVPANDPLEETFGPTDYGELYPVLSLKNCKSMRLTYDFGENYDFKLKFLKPKYIVDPELYLRNVIVKKAKGYGIYEDNITELYQYLEDNSSVTLPFDFEDADIEELHELVDADFDLTRMSYFGIDIEQFLEDISSMDDLEDIEQVEA